ncbi:MAG: VanZ family protein [Flavobacterium sp.]
MLTNNLLGLKKVFLGLSIGWTLLIFILCLISFSDFPKVDVSNVDKIVHFTFYFVLLLLWGTYFSLRQKEIKIPVIIKLVLISICYGVLIEFLQATLTKTRHADLFDVLANFAGALLALLVFTLIKRHKINKL